jgi:hypothetical protein
VWTTIATTYIEPHRDKWQRNRAVRKGNEARKKRKKFTLEQATKAQRGNRCTVLLFLQPRC